MVEILVKPFFANATCEAISTALAPQQKQRPYGCAVLDDRLGSMYTILTSPIPSLHIYVYTI